MRLCFVLTALICGLMPTSVLADDDRGTSLVPTVIGLTVTDSMGQALITPDSIVAVVWKQFGKKPWPAEHWARLTLKSGPAGTLVPTQIPLNTSGMRYLWWYAKVFHRPKIKLGFTVQTHAGQALPPGTRVRIVIWQLGTDAWPEELWVNVTGDLDDHGHIVVPVHFPLTGQVVKNLQMLVKNKEALQP